MCHLELFELQLETWRHFNFRETRIGETVAKFHVAQIYGRVQQNEIKMVTDPLDLYRSLANAVIEVMFASVDVVWATWNFIEKGKIPSLRHTNKVTGA